MGRVTLSTSLSSVKESVSLTDRLNINYTATNVMAFTAPISTLQVVGTFYQAASSYDLISIFRQ